MAACKAQSVEVPRRDLSYTHLRDPGIHLLGCVIIPVFWLGGFRVWDLLALIPVFGLGIRCIVNHFFGNDAWGHVRQQMAFQQHFAVDGHLEAGVGVDYESVDVRLAYVEVFVVEAIGFLCMLFFDASTDGGFKG
jgi:hypothetical protein